MNTVDIITIAAFATVITLFYALTKYMSQNIRELVDKAYELGHKHGYEKAQWDNVKVSDEIISTNLKHLQDMYKKDLAINMGRKLGISKLATELIKKNIQENKELSKKPIKKLIVKSKQ